MIDKNSMLGRKVHRPLEDRQNVAEDREVEWDERKWKSERHESRRSEQV